MYEHNAGAAYATARQGQQCPWLAPRSQDRNDGRADEAFAESPPLALAMSSLGPVGCRVRGGCGLS